MCYKYFLDYSDKIVDNFDKTGFIQTTAATTTSMSTTTNPSLSLSFVSSSEIKLNKTRVDKKLVISGSNEMRHKSSFSDLTNEALLDITQGLTSFIFYFIVPACAILIAFSVIIILKKKFLARRQHTYLKPTLDA